MSSYRTYDEQVYLYRLYQEGRGNLAAVPGTSNHGYGIAVDLAEPWMRDWIDQHGAKYGFGKTEAPSEWWHINYKGGVNFPPPFETLEKGDRGKRVVSYTKKLAFIHPSQHKAYLDNPRRIVQWYWKYKEPVVKAVERFQRDQDLQVDGKIGPRTAKRIDYVFKWQYKNRKKKK
jgi:hypothetical protein